jgi:hypothetical protein
MKSPPKRGSLRAAFHGRLTGVRIPTASSTKPHHGYYRAWARLPGGLRVPRSRPAALAQLAA